MRPTARLLVPYRDEVDESGSTYRTPDIPAGWVFEQESSLWDVKPGGKPVPTYRAIPRRALIRVAAPLAEVDALVALYQQQGRESHIEREDYDPALAAAREAMRSGDRGATREFRAGMRSQVRPREIALAASDVAHGAAEVGAWLLPLLGSLGLSALAAYLAKNPAVMLGAAASFSSYLGTFVGSDDCNDHGNNDFDGEAVASGSGTCNYVTAQASNYRMRFLSAYDGSIHATYNGNVDFAGNIEGTGVGADQFCSSYSENVYGPNGNCGVRCGNYVDGYHSLMDFDGYYSRGKANVNHSINRHDGTSATTIATSTYKSSIGDTKELAAVGTTITLYANGVVEAEATGDSTYSSGDPFIFNYFNGMTNQFGYGSVLPPATNYGLFRRLAFLSHLRR